MKILINDEHEKEIQRRIHDDAASQIEAMVAANDVSTLVQFLTEIQRRQLAEDWNQGWDE